MNSIRHWQSRGTRGAARLRKAARARRVAFVVAASVLTLTISNPSRANNLGENGAWQFQTSADKVNAAAIQDMIQRKKSGYYSAPQYNYTTNIQSQYNCNVSATSQGNQGTNSTVANSPSTAGNSANAMGNNNGTSAAGYGGGAIDSDQSNSGHVGASVEGSTSTVVNGSPSQALNSNQSNSGDQYARVQGSNACAFGALN